MSPIGSSHRKMEFKVFKRRKLMNVEEESSEVRNPKEHTTMVLSSDCMYYIE